MASQAWQTGAWWLAPISQGFKWNPGATSAHSGTDFAIDYGTPIDSPNFGIVKDAIFEPWGGQVDVVTYSPTLGAVTESYLHLSQLSVTPGERVGPGTLLGYSGTPPLTGPDAYKYGNGPHLHFELTKGADSPYLNYSPHSPTSTDFPLDPSRWLGALTGAVNGLSAQGPGMQSLDALALPVNRGGSSSGSQFPTMLSIDPNAVAQGVSAGISRGVSNSVAQTVTAPFKNMGVNGLGDFFWRAALILLGLALVWHGITRLIASDVEGTAAKVAPVALNIARVAK